MPPKPVRGGAAKRGVVASRGVARGGAARGRGRGGTTRGGGKSGKPEQKKVEKPKWSPEQLAAASKIQKSYRQYATLKKEEEARKKKEEMDKLMEEAEKAAWLKMIKIEQEREERETEKRLIQERERKAHLKRMKLLLEHAFDGELQDIQQIISEAVSGWNKNLPDLHPTRLARKTLDLVDCKDANDYTPLSEAAAGGAAEVIEWLVGQGSEPNSIGRYGRSPLYRAAFGGHLPAVQALLQCGGDPRIRADDGATAMEISTNPMIKEILSTWDVQDTDRLLQGLEDEREKRAAAQAEFTKMKCDAIQDQISAAQETFKLYEKQLGHAYCELEKRITEHDKCVIKDTQVEVTLKCVHDAEDLVTILKLKVDDSRRDLQLLKLKLREEQKVSSEQEEKGVKVTIRDLEDVLIRDVGNKIADDGRWPLLIDETGQVSVFVRYTDTNYLNAANPGNMEPDKIRLALLGAIRYGKPLVLDLMGCDILHVVKERVNSIMEGLWDWIMDKTLVTEEKFNKITKKEDGPEYEEKMFWARMHEFKLWVITSSEPEPELIEMFYTIRVKPAPPKV